MRDLYKNWLYGGALCTIPAEVLDNLKHYYDITSKEIPENTSEKFENYQQWYVQYSKNVHYAKKKKLPDSAYIFWKDKTLLEPTITFFSQYVKHICRFRYSFLGKGKNLPYHGMHDLPRIHIPLNESNSIMVIKDFDDIEYEIPLVYGKAYFTNVTKLHKVVGDSEQDRITAFFCFNDFATEELKKKFVSQDI